MPGDEQREPAASRPSLASEYGILGPTEGKGLLPWAWATERLARSRNFLLATTQPDGAPHVVVIWGIWEDNHFSFATSRASRKARNLEANPRCAVCLDNLREAVIVEGTASIETSPPAVQRFATRYLAKYLEESDINQFVVYTIQPRVVFASIADALDYPATATRWRFPDA